MSSFGFSNYLQEIGGFQPLGREREAKLGRIVQRGLREDASAAQKDASCAAQHELIQHNLKFVVKVAKGFQTSNLPIDELTCAGNQGLIVAAKRFDPRYRKRFTTFAFPCIRTAILHALRDSFLIRRPFRYAFLMKRIRQCDSFFEGGLDQDLDKLHEGTGFAKHRIRRLLHVPTEFLSLNAPQTVNPNLELEDAIPSRSETPLESLLREEKDRLVRECFEELGPVERRILSARYGSNSIRQQSVRALGEMLGLNPGFIRRIEKTALGSLRERLGEFGS